VSDYHLLSTWRIAAPLAQVYATILDSPDWPQWWPAVKRVEALVAGDADGVNSVWRYAWQGKLPYRLAFDVRISRVESLVAIEGIAQGDLDGTGGWYFSNEGEVSIVRYDWHVRSRRGWMNLLAPLLRPLFICNHALVMQQGGEGLARRLGVPLLGEKSVDLLDGSASQQDRRRELPNRCHWLLVGLLAGSAATVVQLMLWWLTGVPLLETIWRDSRLTAAIVLGQSILLPPTAFRWDVLLAATLVHFALSMACAVIPAAFARRRSALATLALGAIYGVLIYGVNLYGFTLLFPWFEVARGWVTLVAHLVFGIVLVGGANVVPKSSCHV
jgi:uncharacterized protein YndB with AHSA1/START domain